MKKVNISSIVKNNSLNLLKQEIILTNIFLINIIAIFLLLEYLNNNVNSVLKVNIVWCGIWDNNNNAEVDLESTIVSATLVNTEIIIKKLLQFRSIYENKIESNELKIKYFKVILYFLDKIPVNIIKIKEVLDIFFLTSNYAIIVLKNNKVRYIISYIRLLAHWFNYFNQKTELKHYKNMKLWIFISPKFEVTILNPNKFFYPLSIIKQGFYIPINNSLFG